MCAAGAVTQESRTADMWGLMAAFSCSDSEMGVKTKGKRGKWKTE